MNRNNIINFAAIITASAVMAASLGGCGSWFNKLKYMTEPEPTMAVRATIAESSDSGEAAPEQSQGDYGYNSLGSDELKSAYQTIEENMNNLYSSEFTLNNTTLMEFDEALGAYEEDHPEAFWLSSSSRYSYVDYGDNLEVELNYILEGDELSEAKSEFDLKVEEIIEAAPSDSTDYQTEIYINDYIVDNCEYSSGASMCHNAYGALINGEAVCDGYSKAFQYLCKKLGIDCVGINGLCPEFNQENGESSDTGHMWNCVKIGGEWYHIDVTWNDGDVHIQRHLYFNLTTETIEKNHTISTLYSERTSDDKELYNSYVPECSATEYNYLKRECVTIYDLDSDDELIAAFLQAVRNGEQYVDFLISEDLDYDETTQSISDSYGYQWIEEVNYYNSDGSQISTDSNFYTYQTVNAVTFDLQYIY